jgi:hypothetical protein
MVPPFRARDVDPAFAVIVGVPQVLAALEGVEMRIWPPPAVATGSVSERETFVSGFADQLVSVMVMVEIEPSARGPAGLKLLFTVTSVVVTVPLVDPDPAPLQSLVPLLL